ncbi:MAG TPA: M14 family metallopeptidase [Thermomicrobiales bacterium]|nr:M14 family metallopeptidase [Thermomicrobiales bacterium]
MTATPPADDFTRYLRPEEMAAELRRLAAAYPTLATLESIGRSFEGRDLWAMTLTNSATGPAADKPAIYIDGNHHAGEVTGEMVCLYTIWRLLTGHGRDPALTDLLDRRTFYIRPIVSPDGVEFYLTTPYTLRSTPRPYPPVDPDRPPPGLYPEDLDGDGAIVQMRVADPAGEWRVSERDPRLMLRRGPDETGGTYYRLYVEGRVEGEVGATLRNAPPRWGLDFNRAYPHNWQPEYRQSGAGPYPLYAPETRAGVEFVLAHPNICALVNYHTAGGFCFVLPSSRPAREYPHGDLTGDYRVLSRAFAEMTGQPLFQSYDEATGAARYGSMMDWAYNQLGIYGWVPELWDQWGAAGVDRRGEELHAFHGPRSEAEQLKLLAWNDEALDGKGFVPWHRFDHPQLGPVELGGWTYKFTTQNAPPRYLREICERHTPWTFFLARSLPELTVDNVRVEPLDGDGALLRVSARVANTGFLPTNLSQQALVTQTARPVEVALELDDAEVVAGPARHDLGHLPGRGGRPGPPWAAPAASPSAREIHWLARATGPRPRGRVVARSPKAGVAVAALPDLAPRR